MRLKNKRIFILMITAFLAVPISCGAVTFYLDAKAKFTTGVTLIPTKMSFGSDMYTEAPSTPRDWVQVGTNGQRRASGVFIENGGDVKAGDLAITGSYGSVVNVACEDSAVMTDGSGASIRVTDIEVANQSATAGPGGGKHCAGLGANVLSFVLQPRTDDRVKVGGRIAGETARAWKQGAYSTSNEGGRDVRIDVFYN